MPTDARVLQGHGDDAGVYLLRPDLALVQTVDFFTPIVNDPTAFGMIAAANSLSDVYAMGAKPLTALNIVAFPQKGEPGLEVLAQILAGGYRKAAEAGVAIVGGHTVDDKEPKYGLAVTGVAHPDELFADRTAPGDLLILTKPLGTGILATALKAELGPADVEQVLIDNCARLNDRAAEVARRFAARGVTDVTGFGLVLHALNLAKAGGVGCELWIDALPLLPGVLECMDLGLIPGGTYANRRHAFTGDRLRIAESVTDAQVLLANDAQTSGGLLMALAPEKATDALAELAARGVPGAAIIGRVTADVGRCLLKPGR